MITTLVHVRVKPDHVKDFIKATRDNHIQSTREDGNFRFDVLQDDEDPTKFILYEVYEAQQFVDAHKQTPHYLAWRDKVTPWMAQPREGIRYTMLFPDAKAT